MSVSTGGGGRPQMNEPLHPVTGWGRYPQTKSVRRTINWSCDRLPDLEDGQKLLPFGMGRSYGDCCLNDGGVLVSTTGMNRILSFDPAAGIIRCEAGASLDEVLKFIVPRGWFLPTTPGTRYVTVG